MQKVAIFGGAFNPPTIGHTHTINEVFKNTDTEKIIIVPDGHRLDKVYGIDKSKRIELIRLFINDFKNNGPTVEFDDYFLLGKNNSDSTTYEVDKYFIDILGFQPYHIFGTDISSGIKKWSGNPNKYIQKKLKKIFVPRKGDKFEGADLQNFKLIQSNNLSDVSSTEVRNCCKKNMNIGDLVIPSIKKYIDNNNLYK